MENENDLQEILNPDEVVPETTEVSEPETDELTKAQQLAQNYKIRAEKAEALNKSFKAQPKPEQKEKSDFSIKDIKALSDVHDDDIDEVVDYAKYKGISVAEAKKTLVVQNLLKDKAEQRNLASAANTGSTRRTVSKESDDVLLDKFSKWELPEEDIDKAVKARLDKMRSRT